MKLIPMPARTVLAMAVVVCSRLVFPAPAGAEMPVVTDVRAESLGGAVTAIAKQSGALAWNPAGLSAMPQVELGALYASGIVDTQYMGVSCGIPLGIGGLAIGWHRMANEFEKTSALDVPIGDGTVSNDVVRAGIGVNILPVKLGVAVRYVAERIDDFSLDGFACDAGAQYAWRKLRLGAAWKNAYAGGLTGTGAAGDAVSETIPPSVRAGVALVLPASFDVQQRKQDMEDGSAGPRRRTLTITPTVDVDIPVYRRQTLQATPGIELDVERLVALRLGLHECRDVRAGIALKTPAFVIDYAFAANTDLAHTHILSTTIYF